METNEPAQGLLIAIVLLIVAVFLVYWKRNQDRRDGHAAVIELIEVSVRDLPESREEFEIAVNAINRNPWMVRVLLQEYDDSVAFVRTSGLVVNAHEYAIETIRAISGTAGEVSL